MDQFLNRFREFWGSLTMWQRVLLFGLPAVILIGVIASLSLLITAPPAKHALYLDLEPHDSAKIVAELKQKGIDFTLEDEGKDIYVPVEYVYELRLELLEQGLPQGHVGWELFDENKLGITETGLEIDRQRAIQGELAKTIEALEQVSKATVIISMAPERSFLDVDSRSTASVSITMQPGERLNEMQVEGIKHLVSHSVRRLDPLDVAINDSRGYPLTGKEDSEEETKLASLELSELQHELRTRLERQHESKIRTLLEGPYGHGKVSASVTLEMDFRTIKKQNREYTPVVDDRGLEANVEEHRKRETSVEETIGGVPGTTSNVPGYLGASATEGNESENSEYDLIVNYLNNEEFREEDLPPGLITKRSAAVVIGTDVWDQPTEQKVKALVASAIGANVVNGTSDQVYVQAFEFQSETDSLVQAEYVMSQRSKSISKIAGWAMALVLLILAFIFLRGIVLGGIPKALEVPAMAEAGLHREGLSLLADDDAEEFALQSLEDISDTQQNKMRKEIKNMIEAEPERVVSLLRSWMLEDQ